MEHSPLFMVRVLRSLDAALIVGAMCSFTCSPVVKAATAVSIAGDVPTWSHSHQLLTCYRIRIVLRQTRLRPANVVMRGRRCFVVTSRKAAKVTSQSTCSPCADSSVAPKGCAPCLTPAALTAPTWPLCLPHRCEPHDVYFRTLRTRLTRTAASEADTDTDPGILERLLAASQGLPA